MNKERFDRQLIVMVSERMQEAVQKEAHREGSTPSALVRRVLIEHFAEPERRSA